MGVVCTSSNKQKQIKVNEVIKTEPKPTEKPSSKENNEIDEVRKEYGIEDIKMKSIGFSDSNEKYLKIYIDKYKESGCMRFQR